MMSSEPIPSERVAKVEKDVWWIKVVGTVMVAALGGIYWQLLTMKGDIAALSVQVASIAAQQEAMAAGIAALQAAQ